MNNKGFTLTELLVTIVIMGIITGLAFPSIRKLQEENKNEEFKAYEKVLVNAAKVYMDSYNNWGFDQTNDCRNIKVSALDVKEYKKNGITCDSSYVIVNKDTDKNLSYQPVVICKKNDKEIYKTDTQEVCWNTNWIN